MQDYKKAFVQFAIARGVIRFGEFILKSGRRSPYFFNSGLFNTGASLKLLGEFYAYALQDSGVNYDMLFGPAYKGIPLVSSLAIGLNTITGNDVAYCFNRKEMKDHGEKGMIVGAPLEGDVVIVDDVISAGTSIRESIDIITTAGANPVSVLIALDRKEQGTIPGKSSIQEIKKTYNLDVHSIITLDDIITHFPQSTSNEAIYREILCYRDRYGVG